MLRIMAAGVVAIAVGAMGELILSPQAVVESTHSIVAIDTTAASAPLASLPGSVSDAAERTRTAALSRPSEPPPPVHEAAKADEPLAQVSAHKRAHRSTARSTA